MNNNTHPCAGKCSEFKEGDYVVFHNTYRTSAVLKIAVIADNKGYVVLEIKNKRYIADLSEIRPATNVEIKAEHRIDHIAWFNDMVDANAGVTVITPKGTSKVKGGLTAFVDMGDDAHIENHISPLCVSNLTKNESQPVLILERDNQIIERLKVENVVLQAKVDELQAENKILNQAASTHLKNQMHFKKLYDALVEQLYPDALDLNEPIDGYPKEYVDGYNRAREIAHYNLLEMMESDVEYICAQCDMLGGGGEA